MKVLRPIEKIYHVFVDAKNFLYDQKLIKSIQLKFPIVSVGNLSFGGVGKTPFIILLAEELAADYKINIITKSYKASLSEPKKVNLETPAAALLYGDEACLIQSKLPGCSVWSGPNKASTAAASGISQPDLILLDDGFSHRRLSRNFDLVLIDATEGLTNYLRESVNNLKRAHAVLITKTNLAGPAAISQIEKNIIKAAPHLKNCIFTSTVKTELRVAKADPLFVFCGLGRPDTFIQDLTQQGYDIVQKLLYADHFKYSTTEQKKIYDQYLVMKTEYNGLKIVTTEKDYVKISDSSLKKILKIPAHSVKMESGQKEVLLEKIRQSL